MVRIFGGKYQLRNEKGEWENIERDRYRELLKNDTQSAFDSDDEKNNEPKKETPRMACLTAKNGNKVNISSVSYDDKGLKFDFSLNDDTENQSLGYDDFYNMLIGGGENGTSD